MAEHFPTNENKENNTEKFDPSKLSFEDLKKAVDFAEKAFHQYEKDGKVYFEDFGKAKIYIEPVFEDEPDGQYGIKGMQTADKKIQGIMGAGGMMFPSKDAAVETVRRFLKESDMNILEDKA
jgi:hypothetical protein